jgi:hypothetical protein
VPRSRHATEGSPSRASCGSGGVAGGPQPRHAARGVRAVSTHGTMPRAGLRRLASCAAVTTTPWPMCWILAFFAEAFLPSAKNGRRA